MIYSIRGELIAKEPSLVVIECSGVGYACRTTLATLSQIGNINEEVRVYTYLNVREDSMELFGFYTLDELNCFKMLTTVSGVGPKSALSILSDISVERFALIVASGDSKALTKIKGIGPKIAQRIILELKDKVAKEGLASTGEADFEPIFSNSNTGEAMSALVVLGYSQSDVAPIIAKLNPNLSTSEMIKEALKLIGKKMQ